MDNELVLICGDVHGNYDIIFNFLKKYNLKNVSIIQVGDFGIGWNTKQKEIRILNDLSKRLISYNSKLYAIRGNHDDPSWFNGTHIYNDNLFLLQDYSVININNMNFLGIGGAVSVDRIERKPYTKGYGVGWWKDEVVNYDIDKIKILKNIDVVFTHTAPNFVKPFVKSNIDNYLKRDVSLSTDLTTERKIMTDIHDALIINNDIKYWYYGHFHFSNSDYINKTKFILVDKNSLIEHI